MILSSTQSFILLKFLVVHETQNQKNDLKEKNFNFTMWFKKKCPFPRFPSFRFWPILEIENLETSESFCLLQIFIALVARLKPVTESQINVSHQINIYACFFLNDVNGFLRSFLKKTGTLDTSQTNIPFYDMVIF